MIFPQALGVGYDTIRALLQGDVPRTIIAGVLLVKSAIWMISLGSGTSGGVLAPLLMMGAALGGVEACFLPREGAGFWPLVSMGAILGGTMRAPFTAILFALELTHDINMLLPLLVAGMLAHATTVLLLKRSILTEKVARRGFHITREYATDPLEILFVREVMRTRLVALPAEATVEELRHTLVREPHSEGNIFIRWWMTGAAGRGHPKELRDLTENSPPAPSLGECCVYLWSRIRMSRCGRWSFAWRRPVLHAFPWSRAKAENWPAWFRCMTSAGARAQSQRGAAAGARPAIALPFSALDKAEPEHNMT